MTTEKDTLPAPHPDTPEWAVQLYNTLNKTYQAVVERGRGDDADFLELKATVARHEDRIGLLERTGVNGSTPPWQEADTNPGG